MKKIKLLCIVLIMMLGVSGCMKIEIGVGAQVLDVNDLALEHMEDKYGKKFEYDGPFGSSMGGTRSFVATQEEFPDEAIIVEVENYREDENERVYRDNYLAVKYKQQTIDYITECAIDVWGEANIYLEVGTLTQSAELGAEATFEEFLLDQNAPLRFDVEIKDKNFLDKKQVEEFGGLAGLSEARIKSRIIVVEESNYGGINRDSIDAKIKEDKYLSLATLVVTGGVAQINWK